MSASSRARKKFREEQELEKLRKKQAEFESKRNSFATSRPKRSKGKIAGFGCLGFLIVIIGVIAIASIFGTDPAAPKPIFVGHFINATVVNPASVNVQFSVTNTGKSAGVPSCWVKVQDPSGAYHGEDSPVMSSLKPGQSFQGNMNLIVTSQGAAFVTEGSVSC